MSTGMAAAGNERFRDSKSGTGISGAGSAGQEGEKPFGGLDSAENATAG